MEMAEQYACPACGAANDPDVEYCIACGTHLIPDRCPKCGAGHRPGAEFCAKCGQSLRAPVAPGARAWLSKPLIAAIGLGVAALVAAGGFFLLRGGGDDDDNGADEPTLTFAEPAPIDRAVVTDLQKVADAMPKATGETDRDQVESLMGLPDAFAISFEQDEGGKSERIVRYETWFYFDIQTAFEFADGDLLSNMPIDDVAPLAILPRQYDPADFRRDMDWDDVRQLVTEPDAFSRTDLPEAYGEKAWAYYGEQLMVAFDEEGLSLVETYPLESGSGQ